MNISDKELFEQLQHAFLESSVTPDVEPLIKNAISKQVLHGYQDIIKEVKISMSREKSINKKYGPNLEVLNIKIVLDEGKYVMASVLDEISNNIDETRVKRILRDDKNLYKLTNKASLKIKVDLISE